MTFSESTSLRELLGTGKSELLCFIDRKHDFEPSFTGSCVGWPARHAVRIPNPLIGFAETVADSTDGLNQLVRFSELLAE